MCASSTARHERAFRSFARKAYAKSYWFLINPPTDAEDGALFVESRKNLGFVFGKHVTRPGEENDPVELFQKGGGSRLFWPGSTVTAWKTLLRAARGSVTRADPPGAGRRASRAGVASTTSLDPQAIAPPRNQPGENILAIAHKMAVAEHLGPNDPLRTNLVRFRDAYFLSYEKRPLLISACTYDALLFLMDLIVRFADPKSLSTLGARVLSEMRNRNRFSGILGAYQIAGRPNALYREAALGEDSFILVRAQNGRWMPAKGPGKRLREFKDLAFSPTRALPPPASEPRRALQTQSDRPLGDPALTDRPGLSGEGFSIQGRPSKSLADPADFRKIPMHPGGGDRSVDGFVFVPTIRLPPHHSNKIGENAQIELTRVFLHHPVECLKGSQGRLFAIDLAGSSWCRTPRKRCRRGREGVSDFPLTLAGSPCRPPARDGS